MSNMCSLEHLIKEIKNFQCNKKFSGKINSTSTDDVITCLIMCIAIGTSYIKGAIIRIRNFQHEEITHCTEPWLGMNCKCPLK